MFPPQCPENDRYAVAKSAVDNREAWQIAKSHDKRSPAWYTGEQSMETGTRQANQSNQPSPNENCHPKNTSCDEQKKQNAQILEATRTKENRT